MIKFIILIGIFLLGIYLYNEDTRLKVSSHNISSKKIPSKFDNFKIIQISDFHNTRSKRLRKKLLTEIRNQKPDIIVITGDFIDSHHKNIDISVDFIKNLENISPIYYIPGNHEGNIDDYGILKEKLLENKVIVLENEVAVFEKNNSKINILGIKDPYMAHEPNIPDSEIIKSELNNLNYDEKNFTILLSHRPETFELYASKKIDLVFAGHAHGGQVRVPFIGGLFSPNQGIFPKLTSGVFEKNETKMIVSRGIGNSVFPFRINNKPELIIVVLKNN